MCGRALNIFYYPSIVGGALTQPCNDFVRPRDVLFLYRIACIFCIVIYSE